MAKRKDFREVLGDYQSEKSERKSFQDIYREHKIKRAKIQGFDEKKFTDVQSVFDKANTTSEKVKQVYSADGYKNAKDIGSLRPDVNSTLKTSREYRDYYIKYKDAFDALYGDGYAQDIVNSLSRNIGSYSKIAPELDKEYDFWKNFNNEDEYNTYKVLQNPNMEALRQDAKSRSDSLAQYDGLLEEKSREAEKYLAHPELYFDKYHAAQTEYDTLKAGRDAIAKESEDATQLYALAKNQERNKGLGDADLDTLKRDVGSLQNTVAAYKSKLTNKQRLQQATETGIAKFQAARRGEAAPDVYDEDFENLRQAERDLAQAEKLYSEAKNVQSIEAIRRDPNFEAYAAQGARLPSAFGNVKNKVMFAKNNYSEIVMREMGDAGHGSFQEAEFKKYNLLTDDETKIYNALLVKDESAADAYLASMEDALAYREGAGIAEGISGKWAAQGVFAFGAGIEQFGRGLEQTFYKEALPTSSIQYASGKVLEDIGEDTLGGFAYKGVQTIGNMAPSIAVSIATGVPSFGTAVMGLSASGNAYGRALQEGYGETEARNYAVLVGLSESLMQSVLGGISSLGGNVFSERVMRLLDGVDSALLRVSGKIGFSMLSEGFEEYLQEVLDPVYRNIMFNENNALTFDSPEAIESFILGALTAGVFEAPGRIANTITTGQKGALVLESGKYDELLNRALALDPEESAAYKLAQDLKSGNMRALNETVGELAVQYIQETNDTEFFKEMLVEEAAVQPDVQDTQEQIPTQDDVLREIVDARLGIDQTQAMPEQAEQQALPEIQKSPAVGVVREYKGFVSKSQKRHIWVLDALGKLLKRKIHVVDTITDGESLSAGNAKYENGEYYISLDGVGNAYMYFFVHESIHDIRVNNALGYANLEAVVFDELAKSGEDIQSLIDTQKKLYPDKDEAYWREEVVGNTVPVILNNRDFGIQFARRMASEDTETQNMFVRMMNGIKELLAQAYEILKGKKSWQQMESVAKDQASVDAIMEAYLSALEELPDRTESEIEQTETKGTPNEVRFSKKDDNEIDIKRLKRENEKLRDTIDTLKEQMKLTKGHKLSENAINKLATKILKDTKSKYDKAELVDNLTNLFSYLANAEQPVWEEVEGFVDVARDILSSVSVTDPELEAYHKPIREFLKGQKIALTDGQKAEVRSAYDNIRDYRNSMLGTLSITDKGIPLDEVWAELSEQFPEMFDPTVSEGDMPQLLQQAVFSMRPQYVNPYGMGIDEAAYDLFLQVFEEYYNIPEVKTFADKQSDKMEQLRSKFKNKLDSVRTDAKARYDKKLSTLRQQNLERRRELVKQYNEARDKAVRDRLKAQYDKLTAKSNEKLLKQKARFQEWKLSDKARREESAAKKKYKVRITKQVKDLYTWMIKPTNAKHVPEGMRGFVSSFIETIDMAGNKPTKKAQRWRDLLRSLDTKMRQVDNRAPNFAEYYNNYDPTLLKRLDAFIDESRDVQTVDELNSTQLQELEYLVSIMRKAITTANKIHSESRYNGISEVGTATMTELAKRKPAIKRGEFIAGIKDFLQYGMANAHTFFDEMGEPGREVKGWLRKGWDKRVERLAEAKAFMEKLKAEYDGINALRSDKAEVHTFEVENGTFYLTDTQVMELYLLYNRPDGRRHILGKGIKQLTPEGKLKGVKKLQEYEAVKVSAEEVEGIIGTLKPEHKKIADRLQKFLAETCADWGNEATLELYDHMKFTDPNYWPVRVVKNSLSNLVEDASNSRDDGAALYTIPNYGFTHAVNEMAVNEVKIGDVFDTWFDHATSMATYSGLAAPLTDAMRWFNFKTESGGVRSSMDRYMGRGAQGFFTRFIKDMNHAVDDQYRLGTIERIIKNTKIALIGNNLRVIVQQGTSYYRALSMIPAEYVAKAKFMKSNTKLAQKYCPIALWKSWGFMETNMAKGMKEQIMGSTVVDKARDLSMKGMQIADDLTIGTLWNACEMWVAKTNPELKRGTEDFYEAVGERLSDVIDRTQVVDTVFHRSQLMRSRSGMAQILTAFMSEPTQIYNMAQSAISALARGDKTTGYRGMVSVAMSLLVSIVSNAAWASLVSTLRGGGKDDEKTQEKTVEAFFKRWANVFGMELVDGLVPFNYIPFANDVYAIFARGADPSRMDMQAFARLYHMVKDVQKYFNNESRSSAYKLIQQVAEVGSMLTGIPISNLMRDVGALYSTISGQDIMSSKTGTYSISYETMYSAIASGDKAEYNRIRNKLLTTPIGGSEKARTAAEIDAGIAKVLMENDPRIGEAFSLRSQSKISDLQKLKKEIMADGFTSEMVDKAISLYGTEPARELADNDPRIAKAYELKQQEKASEYNTIINDIMDDGYVEDLIDKAISLYGEDKNKMGELDVALYKSKDLFKAVRSGTAQDINAIYKEMLADSDAEDPKKSVKTAVTGEFKAEYVTAVDKGWTNQVNKLARRLKVFGIDQETLNEWVSEKYSEDTRKAIASKKDAETINRNLQKWVDSGASEKGIKQSMTRALKPIYLELYEKKDYAGMQKMRGLLTSINLKNTTKDSKYYGYPYYHAAYIDQWERDYDKGVEDAELDALAVSD